MRRHFCLKQHVDGTAAGAIFITGASSGIGKAIALDLAGRGVTVFVGVRKPGDAPESDDLPGQVHEILLDITSSSQIMQAADSIRQLLGRERLRAVVNNAGNAVGGPLEFVEIDQIRHQFEVNLFGQLAVTQAVLELIRAHGDGRVLFMSSTGGRIAAPFVGPYAASKHALNGMADSMRRELRPWNIQVSVLAPGAVATPIWDKANISMQDLMNQLPARAIELYGDALKGMHRYIAAIAAGRSIPPEDVVRAVRHALYARHARTAYLIGMEARVGATLSTVLPARIFDVLLTKQMGYNLRQLIASLDVSRRQI